MYKFTPTRFLFGGNTDAAKDWIGPAKSQMGILKNQMSFQRLKQGVRRIWLNQDVCIVCIVNHGFQSCGIWVRPTEQENATSDIATRFVIKPTFNGHFASYGRQRIMYTYQYGDKEITKWFQIYGGSFNEGIQTIEGCSPIFEFDTPEELAAFKGSAKFHVASTPPNYGGSPLGATFNHFYIVDNPTPPWDYSDYQYKDETYIVAQIATGDGTTEPYVSIPVFSEYGFSTDPEKRFELRTYDVDGHLTTAYLDVYGFPYKGHLVSGHFNVLTGQWDIPPVWDVQIKDSEPIWFIYYERNYADLAHTVYGSNYELLRRVDYKEADNTLLTANSEFVTIDGQPVTAYQIEFSGLKLMYREPNEVAKANNALTGTANGVGYTDPLNLIESCDYWGILGDKPDFTTGFIGYHFQVFPGYGGCCFYTRRQEILQEMPMDDTFWGVLSDSDGKNPVRPSYTYSIKTWNHEFYLCNEVGEDVCDDSNTLYCENPFGAGVTSCSDPAELMNGYDCPCAAQIWTWDFSMIDTPAEAF